MNARRIFFALAALASSVIALAQNNIAEEVAWVVGDPEYLQKMK